jgi:glycosyltransferase involved in cell wall biosynthesis
MKGVLVADPGGNPWMPLLAQGLARAGLLDVYVAPLAFTESNFAAAQLLPGAVGHRIASSLRRRALPAGLSKGSVRHRATLLELFFILARKMQADASLQRALIAKRNVSFDRAVARMLSESSFAFVGLFGASLAAFKAAKRLEVMSFLDYPIAHHRFARRLLSDEASRRPDFAGTLQFHDLSPQDEARLDQEIADASRIFVLSTHQAASFLEEGVTPDRLIQLHLGVDVDMFRPVMSANGHKGLRVLFVGQLTQRKGLSYLLDAFKLASIRDSELILVGQPVGDALAILQRWKSIRHIPHIPRDQLPAIYREADVFVLPSLIEGFPLTALEAMACGLPVILSENTFGRDVITDGVDGFVVPIRDSEAIADRLLVLAKDPALRKSMGEAAARRAREFSWDHYALRTTEAIANAVGSRPGRIQDD